MHNYTRFAVALVRRQKVSLGCRSLLDRSRPVIRSFDERDGGTSLVRNRIAWTRCKKETSNQSCISTRLSMYRCVQLKQKRVTRTWITRLECRYRYRDRCKSKRITRSDPMSKKKNRSKPFHSTFHRMLLFWYWSLVSVARNTRFFFIY